MANVLGFILSKSLVLKGFLWEVSRKNKPRKMIFLRGFPFK